MQSFNLQTQDLRDLNTTLQAQADETNKTVWEVENPRGSHAVAVGLNAPIEVNVRGPVGYYCGGMNQQATVHIHDSAGPGVAENMMSGTVVVEGTIALDREFGYGYSYPVLLEDASVTVK